MRMTRRELAASALASAAAMAQNPPPTTAESPEELLKAAREQVKRTGETLAKHRIPMATEPAFQFKA
jgi:hypothetical protein